MNMGNDVPCLFNYATSELSQDAFFAWLLAWADRRYSGAVHDLAISFLQKIFAKAPGGVLLPRDFTIKVERQHNNIDVFCEINGTEIAIILEDKVNTNVHGDQLERYRNGVEDEKKYNNVIGIYCKTGDQSDYSKIEELGYVVMKRDDLTELFNNTPAGLAAKTESQIVADFVHHLDDIDNLVKQFRTTSVAVGWDWNAWKGFYMALQKELNDGDWDYVSNPAGGFMGFWWHWRKIEEGGALAYLQLEEGKACFKVECCDLEPEYLKWRWHDRIIGIAGTLGADIVKPRVMRKGYWMTVAVLNEDYRVTDSNGKLDMEATVAKLKDMENVLDKAVEAHDANKEYTVK